MNLISLGGIFGNDVTDVFPEETVVFPRNIQEAAEAINQAKQNTLLLFGGGEDVHPKMYGHKNIASFVGQGPGHRDISEEYLAKLAIKKKLPMLGICRGAQFLCVMAGGSLIQDVVGHGRDHKIKDKRTGREVKVTSTHHQMQYPFAVPHELIASSLNRISHRYVFGGDMDTAYEFINKEGEPEIVYYPEIKALGVQGHPEYLPAEAEFPAYVRELVKEKFEELR